MSIIEEAVDKGSLIGIKGALRMVKLADDKEDAIKILENWIRELEAKL